jgi:hypothetical protein
MLSNAIQQGHLRDVASSALNVAEYQQTVPWLADTYRDQVQWSGVMGQIAAGKINQYYFSTARPSMGQGTVIPVSIEQEGNEVDLHNPNKDPMQLAWAWTKQLYEDSYVRGDQLFAQLQGDTPTARNRGIANTFTRELHDPKTGESTNLINFAYMPAYPTIKQQQIALHLANDLGAGVHRRNYGNDVYWRNRNQSFRYAPE